MGSRGTSHRHYIFACTERHGPINRLAITGAGSPWDQADHGGIGPTPFVRRTGIPRRIRSAAPLWAASLAIGHGHYGTADALPCVPTGRQPEAVGSGRWRQDLRSQARAGTSMSPSYDSRPRPTLSPPTTCYPLIGGALAVDDDGEREEDNQDPDRPGERLPGLGASRIARASRRGPC